MSRVLGIVPARRGSKRVERKNLRPLGGKPLVAWALEAALGARSLSVVLLSSNDQEVLELADGYPLVRAVVRPEEISADTSPALEYVHQAIERCLAAGEPPFDAIAIVQPSSPFTLAEDIDAVVSLLLASDADSAVSVMQVEHALHPAKLKRLVGDRLLPYLEEERGRMAASDLPSVFVRNGSVYVSRMSTIDGGTIIGEDSRGFVMPRERSLDINDELDLAFAEFLWERNTRARATPR